VGKPDDVGKPDRRVGELGMDSDGLGLDVGIGLLEVELGAGTAVGAPRLADVATFSSAGAAAPASRFTFVAIG
jgi:hypothetical protein